MSVSHDQLTPGLWYLKTNCAPGYTVVDLVRITGGEDDGKLGVWLFDQEGCNWLEDFDADQFLGRVPGPQDQGAPVGEAGSMPGTDGFTMAAFRAVDVPIGTKLYVSAPAPDRVRNDGSQALAFKAGWEATKTGLAHAEGGRETAYRMFLRGFDFGDEDEGESLALQADLTDGDR